MKCLCVVALACVSLTGCATGHMAQPEGDQLRTSLSRVEDRIETHSQTILALRDRLTDTRFSEIRDEIDKNYLLTHAEFTKLGAKLDKLQESAHIPWWVALGLGVGGPAGGYGAYRAGKSRPNGKEEPA